jgi:hypothetical protein
VWDVTDQIQVLIRSRLRVDRDRLPTLTSR